jgi:hypothetical protein
MPNNPMNPQPPIAEPGKERPDNDIQQPGKYSPEHQADPDVGDDDLDEDEV